MDAAVRRVVERTAGSTHRDVAPVGPDTRAVAREKNAVVPLTVTVSAGAFDGEGSGGASREDRSVDESDAMLASPGFPAAAAAPEDVKVPRAGRLHGRAVH